MRKIIQVTQADMQASSLFAAMSAVSVQKLSATQRSINAVCDERVAFEAKKERIIDGLLQVGQSPDHRFVLALKDNPSFTRLVAALKINARSYIHPQSQASGKDSSETSNLKSYNKVRQIAECIYTGSSDLEGVARVFAVCAFRFAANGHAVLTREFCETFLCSREFNSIDQATADLWSSIDDIRAKQMTGGGASTQSGQMVRTLVALKAASDVRDGRAKNVEIDAGSSVMVALMTRLGQDVSKVIAPEQVTVD